jgi:hypothetical protein
MGRGAILRDRPSDLVSVGWLAFFPDRNVMEMQTELTDRVLTNAS